MFGSQFDILGFILFFVLIFLFPRIMMYQILSLLNSKVKAYEEMISKAQGMIIKKIGSSTKLTSKELKGSLDRMMEYFIVEPDSVEPDGLAKKIRYIVGRHDKKMDLFVDEITSGMKSDDKKNVSASIMHTVGLYQITKVIKHFIELIKQTNNFQIGMILQMQLPFIDKQMKALYASVPAFLNSVPVGDAIGPLYAATLIGGSKIETISEDTIVSKKKIYGKDVFILKASGPAANLGKIDEAIRKIVSKNKIDKIITVDASSGLESEKTGSVAEGVGFAMGPRGAERFFAESYLTQKNIPVDAIVVKMKMEEALMPMKKDIKNSLLNIEDSVKRSLREVKNKAIIIGVGQTGGVGNNGDAAQEAIKRIDKYNRKKDAEEKSKNKKRWFNFK